MVAWRDTMGNLPGSPRQIPCTPNRVVTERREVGLCHQEARKRMAKKKHRKLLKRTRIQRRRAGK